MSIKLELARAQQALACGGSEVMEGSANYNDIPTLNAERCLSVVDACQLDR